MDEHSTQRDDDHLNTERDDLRDADEPNGRRDEDEDGEGFDNGDEPFDPPDRSPFPLLGGGAWRPATGVKTRIVVWLILIGFAACIVGMMVLLIIQLTGGV